MSIGYWILAGVGVFSFIAIIGALIPPLGRFLVEVLGAILESIGDD